MVREREDRTRVPREWLECVLQGGFVVAIFAVVAALIIYFLEGHGI